MNITHIQKLDVDEHLIFESLNEEGCWNDVWNRWSNQGDKSKVYGLLNEMNQNFVDIVRNSGGNNTERHLLLAGYCTDIDLTIDEAYVVPKDDRVMVSVHYYTPSTFTILEEDADWGKVQPTWGTEREIEYLLNDFKKIKTRFVDNGIPIVIGEYGTVTKNKDIESVHKFLRTVAKTSLNSGMCPFLWDNGEHFNRKTLVFRDEAIGDIYKELSSSLNQSNPPVNDEKCWSEPDYPCCKNSCYVVLNDGQEWGSENGEWCGIPSNCSILKSAKDSCPFYPDYPYCPTCDVFLTEEDGSRWGVLDGNWCSIKNSC